MTLLYGPITEAYLRAWDPDELDRCRTYQSRWNGYNGDHPTSITPYPGEPNDNLVLNTPGKIVEAGVAALFGLPVTWKMPEGNEPAQALLEDFLGADADASKLTSFHLTCQKLAMNGGVCGTTVYKLKPGPLKNDPPAIRIIDPSYFSAYWDPDDLNDAWAYKLQWTSLDRNTGKVSARRQLLWRIEGGDYQSSWVILDQVSRENEARWHDLVPPVTWPYDWPPLGYCQNLPDPNNFWGRSDLTPDVLALAYGINRVASNTNKIIRLHAHPKLVGVGINAAQLSVAPDEMILLQNPDASISAIEMSSDLGSSLAFFDRLKDEIAEQSRIPKVATGKLDSAGALSGVALSILYGPLVAKTEQKRLLYGPMIEELLRRVLVLQGIEDADPPETVWPEVTPNDPEAERRVAIQDKSLGASSETILSGLGYNAQDELARSDEEKSKALERQQTAFDTNTPDPFAPTK